MPLTWTTALGDNNALRSHAYDAPVLRKDQDGLRANLSPALRSRLAALGLPDPDVDRDTTALPWLHALAIGFFPAWLSQNEASIRSDWPRVPFPDDAALLRRSADLGRRVAALLDPDTPVPGVTVGEIAPALACIAVPARRGGGPMTEENRRVAAGSGRRSKKDAVVPERGRREIRDDAAAQFADLSPDPAHRPALRALGQAVFDELERHSEFRRNNLTYAVGMVIGAALAIERGHDLSDEESALVLATVHEFHTRGSDVTRRTAEEKTALYDTCLLFTGLMAVFEADAQANGHAETRAAARAVSRAVLTLFGFAEETRH
ncbi:MAG: hypothetical protein NZM07_02805 [Elioraea sp.]|nr:hypothetical protein [Elioraea sp.]